jgi:hypothetical protein
VAEVMNYPVAVGVILSLLTNTVDRLRDMGVTHNADSNRLSSTCGRLKNSFRIRCLSAL